MFQFPLTLVPTHIEIAAMPKYARAEMTTKTAFTNTSLLLSNVCLGGKLDLVFKNYPANTVDIYGKYSALNTTEPGHLQMAGWNDAWDFWMKTQTGHLNFEIDDRHPMWNRIDDLDQWRRHPFNGERCVWKYEDLSKTFGDGAIKSIANFKITISQYLRTN